MHLILTTIYETNEVFREEFRSAMIEYAEQLRGLAAECEARGAVGGMDEGEMKEVGEEDVNEGDVLQRINNVVDMCVLMSIYDKKTGRR